jgi:Na+-driven multidrug efflux pump
LSIMGITGAAIASAVAYWASTIAMTWQLARAFDVSFGVMAGAGGVCERHDPS